MTLSSVWHPFTQHGLLHDPLKIERANGAYLYSSCGRKIFDAISSWWVTTHGHSHPKITAAIAEQAGCLDQIIFAGLTHQPAEDLAQKLMALTPSSLTRVFFSDSGSTAVEVALKMALGFWALKGEKRTRILALEGGYHGDTFGAMSVGSPSVYNALYRPFLFSTEFLPCPTKNKGELTLSALEASLKAHRGEVAAFILEPLVLGAGGMKMYGPDLLAEIAQMCKKNGVLVIADEVMTGWGRTGRRFAFEHVPGFCPDLLCLAKGLTGGTLPLAVTLAQEAIFEAFYSTDLSRLFFHSSSYTANPLACRAALATLDIWETEPVFERLATLEAAHRKGLERLRDHPMVTQIRLQGTIAAFDLHDPQNKGYLSSMGMALRTLFLKENLLLRPLGNTVYLIPPYCATSEDLEAAYDVIVHVLNNQTKAWD